MPANKTKPVKKAKPAGAFIRCEPAELATIQAAAKAARQSMTQYAVANLLAAAKKTLENS